MSEKELEINDIAKKAGLSFLSIQLRGCQKNGCMTLVQDSPACL
jgi:hypothetical protein